MAAMKEDKPPPGSSTKELRLSTEAAYLARKTLVLTEEFFRLRYNTAIMLTEGKLDMRTYARREFFKEEQHTEYVNIMELREVARDILLRRSTTERRGCPEWLNCWVYGSELVRCHHPGKPHAYPNTNFTFLLRLTWTDDGWMDTSEWEDPLADDEYHTHLTDLDLDRQDATGVS